VKDLETGEMPDLHAAALAIRKDDFRLQAGDGAGEVLPDRFGDFVLLLL
jgi:hypothetical protein